MELIIKARHSCPNGRADLTPLPILGAEDTKYSECSLGGNTTYDEKRAFAEHDIDQVIAQTVVSSLVHNKHHPDQNLVILGVGFAAAAGLMAVLYDCHRIKKCSG